MHTKHLMIAALLTGAFAPAFAGAGGDAALAAPEQMRLAAPLMGMHGKPVKNAPYSAEVISEQQHSLADGNQIVNKSSAMTYRDSAGRTRHEVRDASGNVRSITIHDAVEGVTFILRPETKIATKISAPRELAALAGQKARARLDELRKGGEGGEREQLIVKRIERAEGEGNARVDENVRIRIPKNGEARALAGLAGLQRLEGLNLMIAGAFGDIKWSAKATNKDLGTKEIDGIKATGTLRSYDIPAGEIGNRNAIVVSNETWYSPELKVTLLAKRSDPRSGERTYRVTGLRRDEPAASLFAVPSDYTIRDVMAMRRKTVEEKN